MMINISSLHCENCPASYLRDKQLPKIIQWEKLREMEYESLHEVRLFLLGESIPASRFFYDRSSDYSINGLRFLLKKELIGKGTDNELFVYMRDKGILLIDCALCPLHKLREESDKILAATFCLQRNTQLYLKRDPEAHIITIFPCGRGFSPESLPDIQRRVIGHFQFSKLTGLKKKIEEYFGLRP